MSYLSIREEVKVSCDILKSKFITYAFPLTTELCAQSCLERLRKEYYDSTHICYAYSHQGNARFSDDGEPSGTAGQPILSALKGYDNVLIAVVRYFGGIKLGTGGLSRAYRGCAVKALEAADVVEFVPALDISTTCDYSTYQILADLLKRWQAEAVEEQFTDRVTVKFSLPFVAAQGAIKKLEAMQLGANITECVRAFKRSGYETD